MTKRLLFTIMLLFTVVGYSSTQPASISSGVDWIIANQNADKSWGGVSSSVTPFNTTAAVAGLNWLNGQTPDSVNFSADRLLTNAIAGLDTTSDLNQLVTWRNNIDGSWGLDGEYANDIIETALALQALKAVNYSDYSVLFQGVNFLTTNQNSDGGWGFNPGEGSNVYITSLALKVLSLYNSVFINQDSINRASAFLLAHQNTDGGFGSSPSKVYETALALDALFASGANNITTVVSNGVGYLTANQLSDGSWNEDPYSTALALRALASARANLVISSGDISLSKPMRRRMNLSPLPRQFIISASTPLPILSSVFISAILLPAGFKSGLIRSFQHSLSAVLHKRRSLSPLRAPEVKRFL